MLKCCVTRASLDFLSYEISWSVRLGSQASETRESEPFLNIEVASHYLLAKSSTYLRMANCEPPHFHGTFNTVVQYSGHKQDALRSLKENEIQSSGTAIARPGAS